MKKLFALRVDDGYTLRSSLEPIGILVENEEVAKKFIEIHKSGPDKKFYNVDYIEMQVASSLEEILESNNYKSLWYSGKDKEKT